MENHITLLHTMKNLYSIKVVYMIYIQGENTQSEPTQHEGVFGTKPPRAKT